MVLKFAANLNFLFMECSNIVERIYMAHKYGFRAIEIPYPATEEQKQKILNAQSETGIQVALLNISLEGETGNNDDQNYRYGTACMPGVERIFRKQLLETIDIAKQLNCSKIHIMSGLVTDYNNSDYLKTYEKNLHYAVKKLEEENLIGLIEPINNNSVPSYFLNNYKTACMVINALNSKHLQLMLDIFHVQQICGNVTYSFENMFDIIGHIQIAQVPHRHEPDVKGELDYEYILAMIEQSNYNNWIGCEYKPKTTTIEGLKWVQKLGYQL